MAKELLFPKRRIEKIVYLELNERSLQIETDRSTVQARDHAVNCTDFFWTVFDMKRSV